MRKSTKDLINILTDLEESIDVRDDAAMDLGNTNDPDAIPALIKIISKENEDEIIQDGCVESLIKLHQDLNLDLSGIDIDQFSCFSKEQFKFYLEIFNTKFQN